MEGGREVEVGREGEKKSLDWKSGGVKQSSFLPSLTPSLPPYLAPRPRGS